MQTNPLIRIPQRKKSLKSECPAFRRWSSFKCSYSTLKTWNQRLGGLLPPMAPWPQGPGTSMAWWDPTRWPGDGLKFLNPCFSSLTPSHLEKHEKRWILLVHVKVSLMFLCMFFSKSSNHNSCLKSKFQGTSAWRLLSTLVWWMHQCQKLVV